MWAAWLHVAREDTSNLWPQVTQLWKCKSGTQAEVLWFQNQGETGGGVQVIFQGLWDPLRQAALLLVKPVKGWWVTILWRHVCLCFPPAFSFYSFFLPRISGFVPQMEMLFLWLTICLDHCQVKSWCLPSRDAATVVTGSLTRHTCLVQ